MTCVCTGTVQCVALCQACLVRCVGAGAGGTVRECTVSVQRVYSECRGEPGRQLVTSGNCAGSETSGVFGRIL